MTVFIKVNDDNSVAVAGTVLTDDMLDAGYVAYDGVLPSNSNTRWFVWDKATASVVENVVARTQDELANIRRIRNQYLADTDWVIAKSLETGKSVDPLWAAYRQSLRDLTDTYTVGQSVDWPTPPGGVAVVDIRAPATPPDVMDNDGNEVKDI